MLKMIIVDDERRVCTLIRHIIDWKDMGIEIIGEAWDGITALKLILDKNPDIVITDIRMPGMDGLELIRKIQEQHKKIHFILLSGHKQFEYAHSAIKYGVEHYLLKPINKDELIDNISRICTNIKEEANIIEEKILLEDKLKKNTSRIRSYFINTLIQDQDFIRNKTIQDLNKDYCFDFKEGYFCILILKADSIKAYEQTQMDIAVNYIYQIVLKALKPKCIDFQIEKCSSSIVCLMNYANKFELKTCILDILYETQNKLFDYCYTTVGLSDEVSNANELSFTQANYAILYRIAVGCNRVINYNSYRFKKKLMVSDTIRNQIEQKIELGNKNEIMKILDQFKQEALLDDVNPVDIYEGLKEIINFILLGLKKYYLMSGLTPIPVDFKRQLDNAKSKVELFVVMENIVSQELDKYNEMKQFDNLQCIRFIKQYIQDHYAENITLQDISNIVHMNFSYLSSLFKKEVGINFSEYLINYRIKVAKELLRDLKLSIAEVGARVGYEDIKYFSKLFIRVMGVKPSDYRKLYS